MKTSYFSVFSLREQHNTTVTALTADKYLEKKTNLEKIIRHLPYNKR